MNEPTLPGIVQAARRRWPGRHIVVTEGTDGIAWNVAALWEPVVGADLEVLAVADNRLDLLTKIEAGIPPESALLFAALRKATE